MATEQLAAEATLAEWVPVVEAARRLGMSPSWFKQWAADEQVEVVRRGNRPGVNWLSVESAIDRSRITKVTLPLLRQTDPELPLYGTNVLDAARARYGSDGQIARLLGVSAGRVSHWRVDGVPEVHVRKLVELLGLPSMPDPSGTAKGRIPRRY